MNIWDLLTIGAVAYVTLGVVLFIVVIGIIA